MNILSFFFAGASIEEPLFDSFPLFFNTFSLVHGSTVDEVHCIVDEGFFYLLVKSCICVEAWWVIHLLSENTPWIREKFHFNQLLLIDINIEMENIKCHIVACIEAYSEQKQK